MQQKIRTVKVKIKTLTIATSLLLFPLSAWTSNSDSTKVDDTRVELKLKQRHSPIVSKNNLYADGIKIKRDLTILKQIQEQRIIAEGEIPADELYQGMWNNKGVRTAYTSIEAQAPDSFKVDLTNFTMPTTGTQYGHVTSNFGPRGRRMHYGIDFKVLVGDTIYAAFDGKIRVKQTERRGYGHYLVVRHTNGLETVYGHLSKFLVQEDDIVRSGQAIALGGNTGRSTGSHLHFEFRFMGKAIDPTLIIDVKNEVTHRDKFLVTKDKLSDHKSIYVASKGKAGYHRVKSGDTLSNIARKHKTSVTMLCALNKITTVTTLKIGKQLRIL